MKYKYQDIIVKTLINKLGDNLDKKTLKDASFDITSSVFGYFEETDDRKEHSFGFYMSVEKGVIFNLCDCQGSEYSIDFTVYDIMSHYNHILCHLDIV